MSIHTRILVMFGVTLVIPISIAVANRVDADEPERGSAAASSAGTPAPERFLLLSNGQILQGVISEDQAGYQVNQRVGVLRYPTKRVEGVFGSVREIYQYKLNQLPERDSEERMKLAQWCLRQRMIPEARDQLSKLIALNPKNQQAQAMLVSIDQAATIAQMRSRDPEVRQTRAERVDEERPAALAADVIRGAQSALRISDAPVIFNLPKPLAVVRAFEFTKYVHPLLQAYCAKCHNETYEGTFQLVQFKSRLDHTPDALRANLDATLRLVDPDNLARSELLSSTLRPHGRGPNKRPIFPGSNDRAYQVLESWVSQLRLPKPPAVTAIEGRQRADSDQSEVFAAHRQRISTEQPVQPARSEAPSPMATRGRVIDAPKEASPQEFPIPFVISGARPALPQNATQPMEGNRTLGRPAMTGATATQAGPSAMAQEPYNPAASSLPQLPEDQAAGAAGPIAKDGESVSKKKPSKPLKLDPNLLQKVLQSRNANP